MKIPVTLNSKKVVLNANSTESLMEVLRREKLYSVKCGCQKGLCGNCMVLLDDEAIPSCAVPVGVVRDCKIVTLESFKEMPEYQDIMTGFSQARLTLCGYCNAGKMLTAYSILKKKVRPSIPQIEKAIDHLDCCCTDSTSLINGILFAIAAKHKREGKNNGK